MRQQMLVACWVRWAGVALATGTAGCTTVTVHNGAAVQTWHFGVVNVSIKPDTTASTVVTTRSLGLAMGTRSAALGYFQEMAVVVPDASKCQLTVVVRDLADLQDLQAYLDRHPGLKTACVATPVGVLQ